MSDAYAAAAGGVTEAQKRRWSCTSGMINNHNIMLPKNTSLISRPTYLGKLYAPTIFTHLHLGHKL